MKRFHYIPLCLTLLQFCLMTSCGDSKRKAFEDVVIEWTGKKILFPDSMRLGGGGNSETTFRNPVSRFREKSNNHN